MPCIALRSDGPLRPGGILVLGIWALSAGSSLSLQSVMAADKVTEAHPAANLLRRDGRPTQRHLHRHIGQETVITAYRSI